MKSAAAFALFALFLTPLLARAAEPQWVTYEGQDVEKGFITFFPAGDASATRGGEIVAGKYTVTYNQGGATPQMIDPAVKTARPRSDGRRRP